jgi:hypothetical protein
MDETFQEALTTLAYLRAQPFVPLYPPEVFMPFGIIVATSFEVVCRDVSIRVALIEGGAFLTDEERERIDADPRLHENGKAHEQRVAGLVRAVALLRGAPLPRGSMENWSGLGCLVKQ